MNLDDAMEAASSRSKQANTRSLGKLAELLERSGIDLDDVAKVSKVRAWQGFYKDEEGEAHTVDMHGIELVPTWASGPAWPVVAPARPLTAKPRPAPKKARSEETIIIAPDPQIGYRWYEDGSFDPFQDERAIDISLQVIRDARPTRIVNLGDTCDFPEWSSKFTVTPEFMFTTQKTIDRVHRYIVEQKTEAPEGCNIDLLEGNHDGRLPAAITKNAMAALRLRRANAPEEWPVLSLQNLLRLEEIGNVTYHDGYPAGRVKLAHGGLDQTPLYAIHGERLTVSSVVKNERQSYVQGHIHRIQDFYETFEIDGERVVVNAWSPGCLSRVDGAVPSVKGKDNIRGVPLKRWENWQQGIGVVTVQSDGTWSKEIIEIRSGRAVWRGNEYTA